jgi:UDP-N-acetylmuramoylalanine--D-glutamate ligase
VLYIEQEHLDVHFDMQDYLAAKSNIARHQTTGDYLVYNGSNQYSASIADASDATKIAYPSHSSAHVDNKAFYYGEQKICSISALQLMGEFNLDNACAAIDAVWPITQDKKAISTGLKNFKGLPHRLKFVRSVEGVDYYDDSIATTPGAAIAALHAFSKPKVIILGGSSKGSNFIELGRQLASEENTRAILIGEEAENIAHACQAAGFVDYEIIEKPTATNFVARARSLAVKGGVVLLSPACASFGLFKNYSDRGDQYIAAVEAL